jgi:pimeloyl-ACP methyl ester carboxylesterase
MRKFTPACLAGLALAATAALAGTGPRLPVVVVFKDGFTVQGTVKQGTDTIVDPATKQVIPVTKAGAFFTLDDGPRRIILSPAQILDLDPKDVNRGVEPVKFARTTRLGGGLSLDKVWQIEETEPWDDKWERVIKLKTSTRRVDIKQRLTLLTPTYVRIDALTYNWVSYYLTSELGPDAVRGLIFQYRQQKPLPELERRLEVYRFFLQAGWRDQAAKELDLLVKALPEQKEKVADLRKALQGLQDLQWVDDLERAHKVGQHKEVQERLARFAEDKMEARLGEKQLTQVQTIKGFYDQKDKFKEAQRLLKELPDKVVGALDRKLFTAAARAITAELTYETLPRLEAFLGQARQVGLDRKQGRKPSRSEEQLLSLAASGWVMGNSSATDKMPAAQRLWKARQLVLDYQKTHDSAARLQMVNSFAKANDLDLAEVAQIIRLLPPPEPAENLTTEVQKLPIKLGDGEGRGGEYLLQLPPEYHHGRASPVLLVLHGGQESARDMLNRWGEVAAQHGYLLAAPEWAPDGRALYQYSAEEHAAVVGCLRDLRRRFQIDSDRVFLFGGGEGGAMAYDVGLSHPDLFAGVLPMACAPRFFSTRYWPNAQYLPFYVTDGSHDGASYTFFKGGSLNRNDEQFKDWVRGKYPALYVEYKGRGGEWFGGEQAPMMDWMNRKKRANPVREVGRDGGGASNGEEFKTMRATDNHFYWLSTAAVNERYVNDFRSWNVNTTPALLQATIFAGNQIYVNARGVKQVTVWLGPGMIDFEKPVTVQVNRAKVWIDKKVTPSLTTLLEDFYQRGDRQRLFLAKVDFNL